MDRLRAPRRTGGVGDDTSEAPVRRRRHRVTVDDLFLPHESPGRSADHNLVLDRQRREHGLEMLAVVTMHDDHAALRRGR